MVFKKVLVVLAFLLIPLTQLISKEETEKICSDGLLIQNTTLISMQSQTPLLNMDVLICNDKIAKIVPNDFSKLYDSQKIIDGTNKFLMPGLIDFHVHLQAEQHLLAYLQYGVTTIVDTSGNAEKLILKEDIKNGNTFGPNLFVASRRFDGNPPVFEGAKIIDSKETAQQAVRDAVQDGYDFIKVYNNLTLENYQAVMAEARKLQIPVIGHIPRTVGAETVLKEKQALILHGEEFYFTFFQGPRSPTADNIVLPPDLSKIAELVDEIARTETAVAPNMAFVYAMQNQFNDLQAIFNHPEFSLLVSSVKDRWQRDNVTKWSNPEFIEAREKIKIPFLKTLNKILWEKEIILIAGTDSEIPTVFPGLSMYDDISGLLDSGIPIYDALAAATINPGEFLSKNLTDSPKLGVVAPGAQADLLLLSANPLENIKNLKAIEGVIVRGQWISIEEIQTRRDQRLNQ